MRKNPRKQASGPNWGLIAGIAMGVVGLVVSGIVIYKATRPKANQTVAGANDSIKGSPTVQPGLGLPPVNLPVEPQLPPPPPLPAGWVQVTAKEVNLKAHLPGALDEPDESQSDMGGYRVQNRGYSHELPAQGGGYELDVMILPAGATLNAEQESQFLRLPRHQIVRLAKGQVTAERSTTLAGAPATEFEFTAAGITGVYRYAFVRAGGKFLFVMAKAAGPKVSTADRQAFLNSIRPVSK